MIFVSLGVDCSTASIFNSLKLRNCSLPFDWVVTYEGITNIIKNDFTNYLPELCDNKYQNLNKNCGVAFIHNKFPDDLEKMKLRIERFKNLLEISNEKIIFVRKSHGNHHHNEYKNVTDDVDDAINLDLLFKEKYPNLIYEIHVMLVCDKCFMNTKINENISTNIKIYNLTRPCPVNANITNPDYFDDLCKKLYTTDQNNLTK